MSAPLKRKLPGALPTSTTSKKQKQNSITSFFSTSAPSSSSPTAPTTAAAAAAAPTTTTSPTTTAAAADADQNPNPNPTSPSHPTSTSTSPTTTTAPTTGAITSAHPPATPAAPALAPVFPRPKFDKEKWVASLPASTRELLKLEIETLHESWLAVLREEVTSASFLDLKRFLARERGSGKRIFPREEEVYSWSQHTPLPTVKAVIIGQDPYHGINQAHGLAFSVRPPTRAPPSLKNMYIALKNDYPDFHPPPQNGGLLTPWADRGVLMLNTCLTVESAKANSHANHGWEKFTQKVIDTVAKSRTRGVVFLAWGTPAGQRVARVNRSVHCVLQSVHPSPLSAARGFFTCGHFKKTNEWLKEHYGDGAEIDWNLNVATSEAGV